MPLIYWFVANSTNLFSRFFDERNMASDTETQNDTQVEQMVDSLVEWMSKQPHLPHIEDRKMLKKFLINCKYRMQKTKRKLDNYYSARTALPSVYQNRDPTADSIRAVAKNTPFFPLPGLTKNGDKVFIVRFISPDPADFMPSPYVKRMFMALDLMTCEEDGRMDYVVIVDFRGFSFQHFLKLTTIAKLFMDIVENVNPALFRGAHYIHAPVFVDKVISLFKMLVKPKLRDRFYVHSSLQALYDVLGREFLPSDLGGEELTIAELSGK